MKKLIVLVAALAATLGLTTCAMPLPEPEPDYLDAMLRAAVMGDVRAGHRAQRARDESSEDDADYIPVSFDELYMLSRYIYLEYGSYRCSDELRLCAGEVMLNRLASSEYPNSLEAVICQSGEEGSVSMHAFDACRTPSRACARVSLRLLMGERMLEPAVVVIDDTPRDGVYAMFCDRLLGNTYFYKSENAELYVAPVEVDAGAEK